MKMRKLLGSKGFTLVEVMVAAGMLSVISLGLMQVMNTATKGSKKIQQDAEVNEALGHIRRILQDQASCQQTLGGYSFGDAIPSIKRNNGNDAFVAGSKYGTGSSSFLLDRMQLVGYVAPDPGNPGQYTDGAAPTQTTVDENGVTRNIGQAVVDLYIIRVTNTAGTAADDTKAKVVTYGGNSLRKRVLVTVQMNAAGNAVDDCKSDQSSYLIESCTSMGGSFEGTHCRNASITRRFAEPTAAVVRPPNMPAYTGDNSTEPALTVGGSLYIKNVAGAGAASNGSVGIISGTAPFALADLNGVPGTNNLSVEGSVGIGVLATGLPGELSVKNSAAIGDGAPVPPNDGELGVKTSIAVGDGIAQPAGDGTVRVKTSVAIGNGPATTPSVNSGDITIERAAVIGTTTANMGPAGTLRVNNSISVGSGIAPMSADGHAQIKNSASIGQAYAPQPGDGFLAVKSGLSVGANGNTSAAGEIRSVSSGQTVRIFEGKINTTKRYNSLALAGALTSTEFVTKEWVNWAIASTMANSEDTASAIAGYIDSLSSTGDTYDSIKKAVCNAVFVNGVNMPQTCTITGVAQLSTAYTQSTNRITLTQINPSYSATYQLKDCSQNGLCANVYSNAWIKGSYITAYGRNSSLNNGSGSVSGSKICISSNCRTTFTTKRCSTGQNVVALGRGGTIGCARDAR
ncbi:prepilin-type N-terminal cleavage/methylation domain-containing protein [Halobacteriovorax sp. HLS]|uniref:prepilin-type N-terminal cleavage/methylation domain-containing protein n=1 Tax=Halobacteriovorax sp. HLS TaxID=2234000 RepID=UPI000FDC9708|nr:prepilin-type N-terminal cleavage/methylation domain-containing protein [Halobacteriovorax sp. HLS]